jgi:hypothetical protein
MFIGGERAVPNGLLSERAHELDSVVSRYLNEEPDEQGLSHRILKTRYADCFGASIRRSCRLRRTLLKGTTFVQNLY